VYPACRYLSYGETPLVNCGPRSYFLYIAITCLLYSHCLLYLHTTIAFHLIRSLLCLQQTGEIDNLIVSWEYTWAWEAWPDPAQKWPGPLGQSMLSGQAWAIKFGPIAKSGRAWADKISIFLKARPDSPVVFCLVGPGLGRDLVARLSGWAGPG
jgi:hypothetical protein